MIKTSIGRRRLSGVAAVPLLAAALTGCGSDGDGTDASVPAVQSQPQGGAAPVPGGTGPGAGGRGFPGANGEVVAFDGSTAQVRNESTGQVAVTWTDDTVFTATVDGSVDDIEVGDCVVARRADEESAEPAESVQVTDPIDGSCVAAGGFGGREGPGRGMPGPGSGVPERPEGAPSGRPGMGGERPGLGTMVMGEVTAVDARSVTIEAVSFAAPPTEGEPETAPATETRTVAVDDTTAVTTTGDADADAVAVGVCVRATGETDDVGAVTAETIAVSDPIDGTCDIGSGFGMGTPPAGSTS